MRPIVREIQSYEWEESTEALARRIGMSPEHVLRFDMNTSPLAPPGLDEILSRVRSNGASMSISTRATRGSPRPSPPITV